MAISTKVSVLIPTYNYAHYLEETIQSVLEQSFTDFELIIVDDKSSDNTDEVVSKCLTDPRVSYYKNENNLGLVANWNKCLSLAKGEYIKFLCADDKFYPGILEKFVTIMDQFPNVSIVGCQKHIIGSYETIMNIPLSHLQEGKKIIYASLKYYNWLGEPSLVMFRRSNMWVGNFNNYIWIIDWEMYVRHLAIGDCYIIPEPLCYCRRHGQQVTSYVRRNFIDHYEEYHLIKSIVRDRAYGVNLDDIRLDPSVEEKAIPDAKSVRRYVDAKDLNEALKKRAIRCGKVLFLLAPQLHKKVKREMFVKMAKIVISEKVVIDIIRTASKRLIRKVAYKSYQ
jgi:glycosyltransferase involved in cell wall biosynthesis